MRWITFAFTLMTLGTTSWADTKADSALRAFEESSLVHQAFDHLRNQLDGQVSAKPQDTRVVLLSSGCGFVGCNHQYLVAQRYSTLYMTNPQSVSVIAMVEVGPGETIDRLTLLNVQ